MDALRLSKAVGKPVKARVEPRGTLTFGKFRPMTGITSRQALMTRQAGRLASSIGL